MKYFFPGKPKGIGGKILSPEDFRVDEVLDRKFFIRFERTGGGVKEVTGPYSLYEMRKRNTTTEAALRIVARHLKISEEEIGYAGLKDKFAVTTQFVTVKNVRESGFSEGGIAMKFVCSTNRHISVGDLSENRFSIVLRNCRNLGALDAAMKKIKKAGLPNYFGPQRFGARGNNHEIGRLIIKREFDEAVREINRIYGKDFASIERIGKRRLKFFVHSYQSWIFNEAVKSLLRSGKPAADAAIFGRDTRLSSCRSDAAVRRITAKEGISAADFSVRELGLSCSGGRRDVTMKPRCLEYSVSGKDLKLSFSLQKGSYATVLLGYIQ